MMMTVTAGLLGLIQIPNVAKAGQLLNPKSPKKDWRRRELNPRVDIMYALH